jgi:hypothetical protein
MPDGCNLCWPDHAEDAWESQTRVRGKSLIDESHFHVTILACSACRQQFVSVFTETIDWADGEDPQYWSLMPITPTEAVILTRDTPDETALQKLGSDRRALERVFDKDDPQPRVFWGRGLRVGPHD